MDVTSFFNISTVHQPWGTDLSTLLVLFQSEKDRLDYQSSLVYPLTCFRDIYSNDCLRNSNEGRPKILYSKGYPC